jgi:5-methylcytosine-specific restriction endonuclease McrA
MSRMNKGQRFHRGARKIANREAHFGGTALCCQWCRRPMKYKASTADHVVPRRLGGKTHPANLVASCWRCQQFRAVELHLLFGETRAADGILRKLGCWEGLRDAE